MNPIELRSAADHQIEDEIRNEADDDGGEQNRSPSPPYGESKQQELPHRISLGSRPFAAWNCSASKLPSAGSQIAMSAPSSWDRVFRSKRRSSGTRDRRRDHSHGLLTPSIISTPKPCPAAAARSRAWRPGRSRTAKSVNEPSAATAAIT